MSWNSVPSRYQNGIIRGYRVSYKQKDDTNYPWQNLNLDSETYSASASDLGKFTNYTFVILAFTSKGDGVPEEQTVQTDEDGNYYNK